MSGSVWNHAPKRLWKRVTIYLRPDIYSAIGENRENITVFVNNAFARKYDLDPCLDGGAPRANRLRQLEQTNTALEQEIASLSAELGNDRFGPELQAELERQRRDIVILRDERRRAAVAAAMRVDALRDALRAIIGEGSTARYRRMLPENDTLGDRLDDWDALVAGVSRRCGTAVDPSEVAAELRRCIALADAREEP